ncbi:hypothetical protein HK097_008397, partial [Rhizophlyctis rosea]
MPHQVGPEHFTSDGSHDDVLWAPSTAYGSQNFYLRLEPNNATYQRWLKQLGNAWSLMKKFVTRKSLEDEKRGRKARTDQSHQSKVDKEIGGRVYRTDPYLFGHPGSDKFRSIPEFVYHFLWLAQAQTKPYVDRDYRECTCEYCPRYVGRLEKFYLELTRPKLWKSNMDTPKPIPDAPIAIFRKREIVWIPLTCRPVDNNLTILDGADECIQLTKLQKQRADYPDGTVPPSLDDQIRQKFTSIFWWPAEVQYRTITKVHDTREGVDRAIVDSSADPDVPTSSGGVLVGFRIMYQVKILATDRLWNIPQGVMRPWLEVPDNRFLPAEMQIQQVFPLARQEAERYAGMVFPFGRYTQTMVKFDRYEEDHAEDEDNMDVEVEHYIGVCFGAEIIRVGDVVRLKYEPDEPVLRCLLVKAIIKHEGSLHLVGELWKRQNAFCFEYPPHATKTNAWIPLRRFREKQLIELSDIAGRYYPIQSAQTFFADVPTTHPLPPIGYWFNWPHLNEDGPAMPRMPVRFDQWRDRGIGTDAEYAGRWRDDGDVVEVAREVRIRDWGVSEQSLVPRRKSAGSRGTSLYDTPGSRARAIARNHQLGAPKKKKTKTLVSSKREDEDLFGDKDAFGSGDELSSISGDDDPSSGSSGRTSRAASPDLRAIRKISMMTSGSLSDRRGSSTRGAGGLLSDPLVGRWRCEFEFCGCGFDTERELERHQEGGKVCEKQGCGKKFHSADSLERHLERRHGIARSERIVEVGVGGGDVVGKWAVVRVGRRVSFREVSEAGGTPESQQQQQEEEEEPPVTPAEWTAINKVTIGVVTSSLGVVFNKPVDPVKDRAPDYFQIIKKPMDLTIIRHKIGQSHKQCAYATVKE